MENGKEVISIRRLAARCISNSEDAGLRTLDGVIEASYCIIKRSYVAVDYTFKFFGGAFFALALISLSGAVDGKLDRITSAWVFAATAIALLLAVLPIIWWRRLQYGKSSSQQALLSLVKSGDEKVIANLNRFFQFLKKEENRLFYCEGGDRQYVDRECLSGKLSLLLLAPDWGRRQLVFKPGSLWVDHELFIEVNVEGWIKGAKANPRPKPAGARRKFLYDDILLALLASPEFLRIDPGSSRCKADLVELITTVWSNMNEDDKDHEAVPGESQLYEFVGKVQASLRKNGAWMRPDTRAN